jgi:radical SAM protein (TIGR01212 family)
MFKYSDSNKRYHTLDYFYKHRFGCKIAKISLNGGFTCPNKDGTKGVGGCIYCSKLGSGDYAGKPNKSLTEQFFDIKKIMNKKWQDTKYIGYFQANTNTYAPVSELKKKYEEILKIDGVVGLNIATRSDAITEDCLNFLEELNKKTFLNIELGLQTIHEDTNKLINRGETLKEFEAMVKKLRSRGINVIVHIINGLPYETKEMMLETIKYVNKLDIQGIKIHMLHIIKDTKLAELYKEKPFHVLTREEYVDIVCDELELLRPEIVINRITGDPNPDELIEPKWLIKKFGVLNEIDKEMVRRASYQGIKA